MKDKSIEISKKHGVNPSVIKCAQCGKGDSIALMGMISKYKCPCGRQFYGKTRECPSCGKDKYGIDLIESDAEMPHEIVTGALCKACEDEQVKKDAACAEMVKAGGIYFKCKDCGCQGSIKAGHPLAVEVRNHAAVDAPNPVGIEFTKEDCPSCSDHGKRNADA